MVMCHDKCVKEIIDRCVFGKMSSVKKIGFVVDEICKLCTHMAGYYHPLIKYCFQIKKNTN